MTMSHNPTASLDGVSVIVPTHGRTELVERLLASARDASARIEGRSEVILVDDSPPPVGAVIRSLCRRYGAVYLQGPVTVGAKRNCGARAARYGYHLHTDSDCYLGADTLHDYLRGARSAGDHVGALAGPTILYGAENRTWQVLRRSRNYNLPYRWPLVFPELEWCAASNLLVLREVFEVVGGFMEDATTVIAGEDVDFGVRLTEAGFRIITRPTAVVYHARAPIRTLQQVARQLFLYGRADVSLRLRHPHRAEFRPSPVASWLVGTGLAAPLALALLPPALGWRSACVFTGVGTVISATGVLAVVLAARCRPCPADTRSVALEFVCVLAVDWWFDIGLIYEAVRIRRPDLLLHRFSYGPYPIRHEVRRIGRRRHWSDRWSHRLRRFRGAARAVA
jgi:hypothetical protein